VVDASVVVAALVDSGQHGQWAVARIQEERLAAPHLLHAEVANVLRRSELAGDISADVSSLAYSDLLDLAVDLYLFEPFADRVWELRHTVTAYDAWYVALAESIGARFATLDDRLAAAPGPACEFDTPP
jgi:predicted nucleic acid-binding protein